jgi:predicted esterase
MIPLSFTTPRTARYLSLGEPGPAIEHVWVCLHGHGQPVTDLAEQLHNLDTPERLLVLPEALSRYELPPAADEESPRTGAAWFAPNSLLADLADLGTYLDGLAQEVLAACPPGTPLTVLGYGHGAAAACRWLAGNGVDYDRLILYAAVFPAEIDRRATLVALPERPVLVVSTTTDTYSPEAAGEGLMQDLLDVGLSAQQRLVDAGPPLPLAVLGASAEA